MKKRVVLLAGLGIGFILGSRAGRQSYEKIKAQATQLWNDPKVQDGVKTAGDSIREKAPEVYDKVKETAPVVAEKVKDAAETGINKAKDLKDDKKSDSTVAEHDVVSDPGRDPVDEGMNFGTDVDSGAASGSGAADSSVKDSGAKTTGAAPKPSSTAGKTPGGTAKRYPNK